MRNTTKGKLVTILGGIFLAALAATDVRAQELEPYEPMVSERAWAIESIAKFGGSCPAPVFAIDIHNYDWWIDCETSLWIIDEDGQVFKFDDARQAQAMYQE